MLDICKIHVFKEYKDGQQWTVPKMSIMTIYSSKWSILIQ